MKQKGLIVSSDNLLSSYKNLSDIEFVIIRLGFTDFNTKKTKHIDSKFYENYELSKKEKLKIWFILWISCSNNRWSKRWNRIFSSFTKK